MELLLTYALPRQDVAPQAQSLIINGIVKVGEIQAGVQRLLAFKQDELEPFRSLRAGLEEETGFFPKTRFLRGTYRDPQPPACSNCSTPTVRSATGNWKNYYCWRWRVASASATNCT